MKRIVNLSAFALIISIITVILSSTAVSAESIIQTSDLTLPYNDEVLSNPTKTISKDILTDSFEINVKDKFIKRDGDEYFRQSNQEYDIDLIDNKSVEDYVSPNNLIDIKYTTSNESGSSQKSKTDDSISVKITLTVDYSITNDKIKMSKVTSKLIACNGSTSSNVGSGVFIVSNSITYGQVDYGHTGQKKTVTLPNKACTKTFNTTSWSAVAVSASIVGATQDVTLRRGNSKWYLWLTNNIIDTMPMY